MNQASIAYTNWYTRTVKNLGYTKGFEAKQLLQNFSALQIEDTDLSVLLHARQLHQIFTEYQRERQGIRWLEKLTDSLKSWTGILEAMVQTGSDLSESHVVEHVVSLRGLDLDEAISLMQVTNGN